MASTRALPEAAPREAALDEPPAQSDGGMGRRGGAAGILAKGVPVLLGRVGAPAAGRGAERAVRATAP